MIALAGSWWFSKDRREEDVRPYLEWALKSAKAETGSLEYLSSFDMDEPCRVNVFAVYADEKALADHRAQGWSGGDWDRFRADFGIDRVEIEKFEVARLGGADPTHGSEAGSAGPPESPDMPLLLMGGSWWFAPEARGDAYRYQSWINSCTRNEPDCLMYLNDLDPFEQNRINSILLFRGEKGLAHHRKQKWVDPEWFKFEKAAGVYDFLVIRYRARSLGKLTAGDGRP